MLIIGVGGLLLQMLDDLLSVTDKPVCWADVEVNNELIKESCTILKSDAEVINHFSNNQNEFIIAVGGPKLRAQLTEKFKNLGGVPASFISPHANISRYSKLEEGVSILHGSIVEASSIIQAGALINANATITHEAVIGAFSEIGPGAVVAGRCVIGKQSFLGAGAVLIPNIKIGDNAVIGAGAVVINDVESETTVVGVPAKSIIK